MGCWDEFCFICGNPCRSFRISVVEDIKQVYHEVDGKNRKKRDPYYEKVFQEIDKDRVYLKKLMKFVGETKWLDKCTFLTVMDEVIHGCRETSCNITFQDKRGNQYFQDLKHHTVEEVSLKGRNGIFLHDDCWKFVKKRLGIALKFSDVALFMTKGEYHKYNSIVKYGPIEKYWSQDFKFIDLFVDSNKYISESPLKNAKNAIRIKKIIGQFKINTDKGRKGPSVSASFYPENTIKYGINGILWVKKRGKWNELKDSRVKKKFVVDADRLWDPDFAFLKNIASLGEATNRPIVITRMKEVRGGKFEIELQGELKEISIAGGG